MKKRLIAAGLIGTVLILLVPAVAYAISYYLMVMVENEAGGSDYDRIAIVDEIDNDKLAELGYISSSGLDTRVISGSTPLKHMVADTKLAFVAPDVKKGVTYSYPYNMGNEDLESFAIIPGYDGYITISDYDALELGNNFESEMKGWVDTSSGSNKNLVYKNEAFRTCVGGANEITSSIWSSQSATPTVAATNGGTNAAMTSHTVNLPAGIASGNLLIVTFAATSNPTITFPAGWTQLFSTANGTVVKLSAAYRVADGGEGASITVTTSTQQRSAYASYRIIGHGSAVEAGTAATGVSANPNPPSLTPTWGALDTLWFAIEGANGLSVSSYPANYTGGLTYTDAGSNVNSGSAQRNLNAASEDPGTFTLSGSRTWVANTIAVKPGLDYGWYTSVTATGVSSGVHTVKTIATGGGTNKFQIWVGDGDATPTLRQEIALNGASVPPNNNDWYLMQNNVMPYMDYYKHTVSGTLIAHYKPNSMIIGTTLPDREGAAQNATITWGTMPETVNVSHGYLHILNLQQMSDTEAEGAYMELFGEVPPMPPGYYGPEDYTVLPGTEVIAELAEEGGIPLKLFWVPIMAAIIIFIGFLVYSKTRHIMAVAIGSCMVMGIFTAMGMLAGWVMVPYVIMCVTMIIAEKTYGF